MGFLVKKPGVAPSAIRNKVKRGEVVERLRLSKAQAKSAARAKRARDEGAAPPEGGGGAGAPPPRQKPRTIESAREGDDTVVAPDDAEVLGDEADDELAPYFSGAAAPKLMLTTSRHPSGKVFGLLADILAAFPSCFYYKRGHFDLPRICAFAVARGFTHLLVLTERNKVPNGLIVSHLGAPRAAGGGGAAGGAGGAGGGGGGGGGGGAGAVVAAGSAAAAAGGAGAGASSGSGSGAGAGASAGGALASSPPPAPLVGPTAAFRLSSGTLVRGIKGHGARTEHVPELLLNGFSTRLGRRVGRLLGSLFPHAPEFRGRQVVTFHCQRDFIFFRQHRYEFAPGGKRVALQELGPRFTLRPKYVLAGPFDRRGGAFEWLHKKEQDLTRTTFQL